MSIKIIGAGHCAPARSVTNAELSGILDTSDEWIRSRTGISSRHVAGEGERMTEITAEACRRALANAGVEASELDLIIAGTMVGDYYNPSLACLVQAQIGAACPAFDINAACSGFLYSLDVANSFISMGRAKRVLVIGADFMSKLVDWEDRRTAVLFGDGAGAAVVAPGDSLKYIRMTARGNSDYLRMQAYGGNNPFKEDKTGIEYQYMNGAEVFKYAVTTAQREWNIAAETLGITADEVDFFLLHQANKRIIDAVRERIGQPPEKFPSNIDRYGCTSAASIPILLSELLAEGKIKPGDRVCMLAFGGGLTSGTAVFDWQG